MNTDLQSLIAFCAIYCKPGSHNPLSIQSAAQLVNDLSAEQTAAFQQALHGVPLEPGLAALIAQKRGVDDARRDWDRDQDVAA
jgi:hypothetical protein